MRVAHVPHTVVESVVAVGPQLDRLRSQAVAAPERRQRNVLSREALLGLGHQRVEGGTVGKRPRLR